MLSKLAISFFAAVITFLIAIAAACAFAAPSASYDPNLAWTSLWYAKVSSCTNAAAVQSWTCGPSCDYFPNFQMEGVFTNSTYNDLAFVGYDPDRNWVVVSIQGSEDIAEWITDADFKQTPAQALFPSAPADAMIHQGFLNEWQSYGAATLNAVSAVIAKNPNAEMILVTGHSLGGAVSLLAGLVIIQNSPSVPVRVYTYGEPRVGNPAFASWAQQYGFSDTHRQFRLTHAQDIVPHLPPMSFGDDSWLHVPQEVWYDNNGNTSYKLCTGNAVQGKEDPNCSDGTFDLSIHDHLYYLGVCTACSCGSEDLAAQRFKLAKLRKNPKYQRVIKMVADDKKNTFIKK